MYVFNGWKLPLSVDSVKGCWGATTEECLLEWGDRILKKDLTQVTTKPEADTGRLGSGCPMIYVFMVFT